MYTKTMMAILLSVAAISFAGCEEINENEIKGGNIDRELPPVAADEDAEIRSEVFGLLDLDRPGLEKVKSYYEANDLYRAAYYLREYWRDRSGVHNPNVDLINTSVSASEQNIADQALQYRFRVSNSTGKGFCEDNPNGSQSLDGDEVFYNFKAGEEIDWTYRDDLVPSPGSSNTNPDLPDQEWLFQKHRHQWMDAQAKAYWISKNENYILNWIEVYSDWMATYPIKMETMPVGGMNNFEDYEWKGLQVAERVTTQLNIIPYYIQSENFTPEWLCTVLYALHQSVEQMRLNYYTAEESGNILISQAQSVAFAGILLPEFKKAEEWAEEGTKKMAAELDQFNDDGVHIQLDPSYHISAISDYIELTNLMFANGRTDLTNGLMDKLEDAMTFVADITYPDYSIDNWNDTRSASYTKNVLKRNFSNYMSAFPANEYFKYMATEGADGRYPSTYVSYYPTTGYYVMRNGWSSGSTMMVLKNCDDQSGEWHNQPDNGTFSIWHKGRNFFPDAGCYSYDNGIQRSAFAATANHNTASLDTDSYSSSYRRGQYVTSGTINGNTEVLITKHDMQSGVTHRRSVFFVERSFFVIVDEVSGPTAGKTVNLNFHLLTPADVMSEESTLVFTDAEAGAVQAVTTFADGNNMLCRTYLEQAPAGPEDFKAETVNSWYSNNIGVESGSRLGYRIGNTVENSARFITVIYPISGTYTDPDEIPHEISATFTDNSTSGPGQVHNSSFSVRVSIDGKDYPLAYSIPQ